MVCPKCQSESVSVIAAEVRLYRNTLRTLSHPPVAPSPDVKVCLDCGWSEFADPRLLALQRLAAVAARRTGRQRRCSLLLAPQATPLLIRFAHWHRCAHSRVPNHNPRAQAGNSCEHEKGPQPKLEAFLSLRRRRGCLDGKS